MIGSFLGQYYLERPLPAELILSHAPEDIEVLSEALNEHAGHKVELKTSVRADRARFLDMARPTRQRHWPRVWPAGKPC